MQSLLVLGDGASRKSDSVLKVGGAASNGVEVAGAGADMWRCEE